MNNFSTQMVETIFVNFFKAHQFEPQHGSPLVDNSIPMSFVMSAGWAQIEQSAQGLSTNTTKHWDKNIVFVQNCFRHFDMQQVSCQSPVHLSLFRMAGAFHFGVIDPALHISMIWDLFLQYYKLPPEKIWVTYFAGGEVGGRVFQADTQTYRGWVQTGIARDHIYPMREKNFWVQSHGSSEQHFPSKCGPTTEVFIDRGKNLVCGVDCHPGDGCKRFVEVMNVLFIQWQISGSTLQNLMPPFTEMVLGVERMAMLKQEAEDIYHIDVIQPLLDVGISPCQPEMLPLERKHHLSVIADHIRALVFLVADGAPPPGKGGRAFIVRKLMREIFTSCKLLGFNEQLFFEQLLPRVIEIYTPIHSSVQHIEKVLMEYLQAEGLRFEATLIRARRKLERIFTPEFSRADMLVFKNSFGVPCPILEQWLDQERASYEKQHS